MNKKKNIFMCDFITLIHTYTEKQKCEGFFFKINIKCKKYENCHDNFFITNQIYRWNIRFLIIIFI